MLFPTHIPKDDVAEGLLGALLMRPDDKAAANALADRLRELQCDLDDLADHLTKKGKARELVRKTFQVAHDKLIPVSLCLMTTVFLAEAFGLGGTPEELVRLGPRPADDPSMDDLRDALERIRRGQGPPWPWIERPGIPAPYFGVPEVDNTYRPSDTYNWVHTPSSTLVTGTSQPATKIYSTGNTAGG